MWLMNREAGRAGSHPHASENWMKVLLPKDTAVPALLQIVGPVVQPIPHAGPPIPIRSSGNDTK